jgi:hypothetical protein
MQQTDQCCRKRDQVPTICTTYQEVINQRSDVKKYNIDKHPMIAYLNEGRKCFCGINENGRVKN